MTPDLILPYEGILPVFASRPVWCGRASTVIGTATLGPQAWLGDDSVIRSDGQPITAGERFWLGPRSTVHIATESLPTHIGDRVTVGRNAVVHACTVGSDVVIEDDAIILDGARVGDNVLIEAGATIFPRSNLESGFAYGGNPAKRLRPVTPEELAERAERLREASGEAASPPAQTEPPETDASVFVARTARLSGRIALGAGATVLFSCELTAEVGPIVVGADTNIQDNTVIRARGEGVVIGRDTTIGHNVRMADCRIGARSLIGIGSVLAPGTVVADDVMLAGGSTTDPGQLLEGGHLWGGRPARILGALDPKKRALMSHIVEGYCRHGREYRLLQEREG
ncbi:gamma carbonic anhydrase family protein [Methylorubrum rhodesianum]|uniref:Gamma carbonic anhydrase family protein n=1 Tax=Methylorubrum rhodesianum TaxID=29427 RepID=A0ABU9Z9U4_9HYPH|nr:MULTISPECIES: gamma carbonic anhydrase family protein [Methylorubrum]MBB5762563.1 carbonic anhydrase/acetyltransferase-like protein (isoleucine patch superfamily) [Methylorubrum rhodesianum]MBI1688600.1 gamma carbonic anhydrase family protein [Methylorubrum sp. DB1722]MBK3402357.1 gamma carbonic anhydrase family protein [Methylorubrum rhodesianum]MBY0142494.1 gamma carbonic anhydrase family protein [Methylorubrum populi]